jgi:hypothetical protein
MVLILAEAGAVVYCLSSPDAEWAKVQDDVVKLAGWCKGEKKIGVFGGDVMNQRQMWSIADCKETKRVRRLHS